MLLNEFINCKKTLTRSVKKYVSGRLVCHAFFLATFPKQFKNKHFLSLSVTFIFIIVFPVIVSVTFRDYTHIAACAAESVGIFCKVSVFSCRLSPAISGSGTESGAEESVLFSYPWLKEGNISACSGFRCPICCIFCLLSGANAFPKSSFFIFNGFSSTTWPWASMWYSFVLPYPSKHVTRVYP